MSIQRRYSTAEAEKCEMTVGDEGYYRRCTATPTSLDLLGTGLGLLTG